MCNKTDEEQQVHELVKVRTKLHDWVESLEEENKELMIFAKRYYCNCVVLVRKLKSTK